MRIAAAKTSVPTVNYVATKQGTSGDETPEDRAFSLALTFFRETNVEALRIRQRLCDAVTASQSPNPVSSRPLFVDAYAVILDEIAQAVQRSTDTARIEALNLGTLAWCSREIAMVENAWDDLARYWLNCDPAAEAVVNLQDRAQRSIKTLEDLSLVCARITIPNELNNYLANVRIGKSLNFVATFRDQLPSDDLTKSVLATLAPQSGIVSGLIDLTTSSVIKADSRLWRQVLSVVFIAIAVALGFGLVALAVHADTWLGFDSSGWPVQLKNWAALNGAYILVLIGVVAHWVLDRIKQTRGGADVTPISEWLLWLHVNEVPIMVRIATVWLMVAMGVAFKTFNLATAVQPVTYFTAGYFLDSTFDALIGRFNTFINDQDPEKTAA